MKKHIFILRYRPHALRLVLIALLTGVAVDYALAKSGLHQFTLVGGHFFGPGPIVPDTSLPVGYLRNIKFDLRTFSGYAKFANDGSQKALLSDGKTRINQNIDAGVLDIGGGDNPVLLVAVKGGRNKGREYYRLADDYSFVWSVDIALDPGFAEGIIMVEDFLLTTGLVKIAKSAQTEQGIPGGYDQAGSLKSGRYLAGRVGDFNQDGFMDGIVVAAPRVPLDSNMLPGAPVGNQRGFETDVRLPAHLAGELTLRGIAQFEGPLKEIQAQGDEKEVIKLWEDIELRINAAQINMDRALNSGAWNTLVLKQDGTLIAKRVQKWKAANFPALSENPSSENPAAANSPATANMELFFNELGLLLKEIKSLNSKTTQRLPERESTRVSQKTLSSPNRC